MRQYGRAFALFSLVIGYGVLRYFLWRYRYFNPDELFYMHTAYCVSHGLVMFRDFWEFHGPLLAYLVAPLVKAITNPVDALFAARLLMFLPGMAVVVALWHAAGDLVGHRARWLSFLLLCSDRKSVV